MTIDGSRPILPLLAASLIAFGSWTGSASAKVPPERAAELGGKLTPMGSEAASNVGVNRRMTWMTCHGRMLLPPC